MAKIMLSKDEYLKKQGQLEEATNCCGKSKVFGLVVLLVSIAVGLAIFKKSKDQ